MDPDFKTYKDELEKLYQGLQHFYPRMFNADFDARLIKRDFIYRGQRITREQFIIEVLDFSDAKDDLAGAINKIIELHRLSDQELAQTLPGKETLETGATKAEEIETKTKEARAEAKQAVETSIKKQQEIHEAKTARAKAQEGTRSKIETKEAVREVVKEQQKVYADKIEQTKVAESKLKNGKLYVKVEEPAIKKSPQITALEDQAKADAQKFVADAAEQFKSNPSIKDLPANEAGVVTKEAAIATYHVLTGNSPLVQAAIIKKVVSDPQIVSAVLPDTETQKQFKEIGQILIDQKLQQYVLARNFADLPKIDGFTSLDEIKIDASTTPRPGYQEFDLRQNVFAPQIDNLSQQSLFAGTLRDFGETEIKSQLVSSARGWLDSQIAKLPAESLVARAYNSEVVQLGLSSVGLVKAAPWVAAEGSFVGKIAISSGLGNVAGFIQTKTGINLGVKLAEKAAVKVAGEAAVGAAAKTGLAATLSTALGALGSWAPIVGNVIGFAAGWLIGKIVEKIPWDKVKKYGLAIASILLIGPGLLLGMPLLTLGGLGIGAIGFGIGRGLTPAGLGFGITNFFRFVGAIIFIAIGKSVLITLLVFPVVVALILFIINSGAYIVPPSTRLSDIGADNPYILVTKTPNPSKLDNAVSKKIEYTITITALKGALTNIKIVSTDCTIYKKAGGQIGCPAENIPPLTPALSVSPSSPHTFTFSVDYGPGVADSLIYDSITISADTPEESGVTTTGSAGVCVGDCAVECIAVSNNAQPWPSSLRSNVEGAVQTLGAKYPKFVARICKNSKEVNLCYGPSQISPGYYAWHAHQDKCDVYFNEKGVGGKTNATFMVSHELTHHIQSTDGSSIGEYLASGGFFELAGGGFCTYRDTAGSVTESMAEACGLYAAIPSWGGCVSNYRSQYPRNFVFAKGFME
jgi:hypothetical protein